ncbi:hypothetical protein ACQEU3_08805 [Spirillospora sp. CA-253888]
MNDCSCGRHRRRRASIAGLSLVAALFAFAAVVTASVPDRAGDAARGGVALAAGTGLSVSKPIGVKPPSGDFYSYAPSVMEEGDTRRVFYCGNSESGKVHDHVMMSVGTKSGGKWTYGAPRVAFGPEQAPAWSNYHTCDPEVLRGQFTWNGHTYPWAVFFTAYGCQVQTAPCPSGKETPNQLGVAFSDSLDAPPSGWKVYPTPLVSYQEEFGAKCAYDAYCVGQPSATSIDGAGRFLLFYQGKDGFVRREVNLANVAQPVLGAPMVLPGNGLPDWLHNGSLVYSPDRDRFFVAYDSGLWNKDPNGPPVQTNTVIASIDGSAIWNGTGTWRTEDTVTPAHSGHAFNHNPGLVRTPAGTTASSTGLEVVHTVANGWTPSGGWGVWTYRLWSNTLPLAPAGN